MTDLRTIVMRSASARDPELASFRQVPVQKLLSDLNVVFKGVFAINASFKGGAAAPVGGASEYELTCGLRFVTRCIVAADDPNSRGPEPITPRADLMDGDAAALVQTFHDVALLFCGHVSQHSVGLLAVDGLFRLVSVYGDKVLSIVEGQQQDAAAAAAAQKKLFNTALERIVDTVFLDLAVQELPTMCRRNAIKLIAWFTTTTTATSAAPWAAAIECCRKRIENDEDGSSSSASASTSNPVEVSLPVHVACHALWVSTISEALNEERDPVNVMALFDISVAVHAALLRQMRESALWKQNRVADLVASKILLTEQQRNDLEHQLFDHDSGGLDTLEDVQDLVDSVENLFQVSSGYFPLQFTPAPGTAVKKDNLIDQLHTVLSLPLFGAFAMPLILHKMTSATATSTIMSCVDVLRRTLAAWGDQSSISNSNISVFSPKLRDAVARRFLKELFPFLRAFILHQGANQSEAVAGSIIGLLADAASVYDASFPSATTELKSLFTCPTLSAVAQSLPSNLSAGGSNTPRINLLLLDASMVHALGRSSPLLALYLGAAVLPLVADEEERIATTSAVFANFEMNSAPTKNNSGGGGCCKQDDSSNNTTSQSFTLGSPDSPRATALRARALLDEKSQQMIHAGVEGAIRTATRCLAPTSSSSADENSVRAAADTVASAACLRARNLPLLLPASVADKGALLDTAVEALLQHWLSTLDPATWRNFSPSLVSALSSAVGVCLCILPAVCRPFLEKVVPAATVDSAAVRNLAATLHGVISGVAAQHADAEGIEALTVAALRLREAATEQQAVAAVDRLCIAPLGDVAVARGAEAVGTMVARLRAHTAAAAQQQEGAARAFVLELVFEMKVRCSCGALNNNSDDDAAASEAVQLFDALTSMLDDASASGVNELVVKLLSPIDDGRIAGVFGAAVQSQSTEFATQLRQQLSENRSPLFVASMLCSALRLSSIAGSDPTSSIAPALRALLQLDASRGEADICLAEVIRPSCLAPPAKAGGGGGCCGGGGASSTPSSSSWRVIVAKSLISGILLHTANSDDQDAAASSNSSAAAALHFCAVLAKSLKESDDAENNSSGGGCCGGGGASSAFEEIIDATHKDVISLLGQVRAESSSNSIRGIDDSLNWLEWLLDGSSTRDAAMQYLLLSEPLGEALLQLADIAADQEQQDTSSAQLVLLRRERALKILARAGKVVMELCVDKDPRGGALEGAVRPLVPVIVKKVQACLSDKKRIVRAAAAECRHLWLLVPQTSKSQSAQRFG